MKYTDEQVLNVVKVCLERFAPHKKSYSEALVIQLLKEIKPSPPKLRPMSELPEQGYEFVFVIKNTGSDKTYNEIGRVHGTVVATGGDVTLFLKAKDYKSKESTHRIIGWLYELPNPNEIEL